MDDCEHRLRTGAYQIEAQEEIVFGRPAEEVIGKLAQEHGFERVFITSTRSLAGATEGPLTRIERCLGSRLGGTFTEIGSHSPQRDVLRAAHEARRNSVDWLVAVGGGSVIDATKALALCLWFNIENAEEMNRYSSGFERMRSMNVDPPHDAIRMASVSTTLSASEFTRRAGITDTTAGTKQSYSHRLMAPRHVILDPRATLDTPLPLLFSTGIRAVDHAVETFCSPLAHPASEAASLQGLRLLSRALRSIKAEPSSLGARLDAQFGMWQAITPIAAGITTGASHAIGYALGAGFGVPHGHTSCVMLPAVLRFNTPVIRERLPQLAQAMGARDDDVASAIERLVNALGLPGCLPEVGIRREDLPELAARALDYHPLKVNPRAVTSREQVMQILELAWSPH